MGIISTQKKEVETVCLLKINSQCSRSLVMKEKLYPCALGVKSPKYENGFKHLWHLVSGIV